MRKGSSKNGVHLVHVIANRVITDDEGAGEDMKIGKKISAESVGKAYSRTD